MLKHLTPHVNKRLCPLCSTAALQLSVLVFAEITIENIAKVMERKYSMLSDTGEEKSRDGGSF